MSNEVDLLSAILDLPVAARRMNRVLEFRGFLFVELNTLALLAFPPADAARRCDGREDRRAGADAVIVRAPPDETDGVRREV